MIKEIAKNLYPTKNRHKLQGFMCWEVMGEMGYGNTGEYMAYKNLMFQMAVMSKLYENDK